MSFWPYWPLHLLAILRHLPTRAAGAAGRLLRRPLFRAPLDFLLRQRLLFPRRGRCDCVVAVPHAAVLDGNALPVHHSHAASLVARISSIDFIPASRVARRMALSGSEAAPICRAKSSRRATLRRSACSLAALASACLAFIFACRAAWKASSLLVRGLRAA